MAKNSGKEKKPDLDGYAAMCSLLRWKYLVDSAKQNVVPDMSAFERMMLHSILGTLERFQEKIPDEKMEDLDHQYMLLHAVVIAFLGRTSWGRYIAHLLFIKRETEAVELAFLTVPCILQPRECLICSKSRNDITKKNLLNQLKPVCGEYCKSIWESHAATLRGAIKATLVAPGLNSSHARLWTAYKTLVQKRMPRFLVDSDGLEVCNESTYTPRYTLVERAKNLNLRWWDHFVIAGEPDTEAAKTLFDAKQFCQFKKKNPAFSVGLLHEEMDGLLAQEFRQE